MTSQAALKVRSHVGRDLLQSAQLFRHEHAVVWEYVANGLEYKDPATKPVVVVQIDPKAKTVKVNDNGRGMLMEDLQAYFQMHGENRDRKQGKPGRGLFGTGKSAAFGIATSLTITTVCNGRRSKVQLTKESIQAQADGGEIPVQVIEQEIATKQPNGTLVEIDNVLLKQIDIGAVIRHIERHIAHWPDASVDETGGALHDGDVREREPTHLINTVCNFEEAMHSVELSLTPQARIHGGRCVLLYELVQIRVCGVWSRTDKPSVCILEILAVAKA